MKPTTLEAALKILVDLFTKNIQAPVEIHKSDNDGLTRFAVIQQNPRLLKAEITIYD